MLDVVRIPDLTFPQVELGRRETPWDLLPLLYRGGGAANAGKVAGLISSGALGAPLMERVELVVALHSAIAGKLAGGGSQVTQVGAIESLRAFFGWADQAGQILTLKTVVEAYLHWADYLLHRARVKKEMSLKSAYGTALRVSNVLDGVLERATPLIGLTRLIPPARRKTARGVQADKQNLAWTFAFGRLLQDICDALTLKVIWGPLPVRIALQNSRHTGNSGSKPKSSHPPIEDAENLH